MKYVPFTLHIEVFPTEPGKRFENIRELQKFASYIYGAIEALTTVNLAWPGGGQEESAGYPRGYVDGTGITPQMGEQPPKLMVTGFNIVDTTNDSVQTEPEVTLIANGQTWTGYGGAFHYQNNPNAAVATEVKTFKSALEVAIDSAIPATYTYKIMSLNYNGIKWGYKGLTFPI